MPGAAALGVVYAVTFVAFLDNFAMLPTIGPFARSLGADQAGVGVAVAAYSLANVPGNVVGGLLADRIGRRRVALVAMAAAAVAVGCYPLAADLPALLALRLAHGFAGGVLVAALFTMAGDLAPAAQRGRTMGRMGAMIGTAAVVAPAVAGVVRGVLGFTATFLLVSAVMLAGCLLLARRSGASGSPAASAAGMSAGERAGSEAPAISPRGRDDARHRSSVASPAEGLDRAAEPSPRAGLLAACLAVLGFTTGFGVLTAFLPSQVEEAGASAAMSGGLFAGLALVAVGLMLSRLAGGVDRGRLFAPLVVGLVVIAAALAVLALLPSLGGAIAGCMLFGAGFGVVYPAATAAVAAVPSGNRGKAFGAFNATYSMGFIVGPPVAGGLSFAGVSPYAFAAGMCLVCITGVGLVASRQAGSVRARTAVDG